ncbi:MAG: metallophosphoesterase [Ignavibacteriaceae bacterium]
MILFFIIFFSIYTAANYYIILRGWQALEAFPQIRIYYLVSVIFLALSYLIAKIFTDFIPGFLYDLLLWAGSFWFAFMLYLFLSVLLIDIIRFLNWQINFLPEFLTYDPVKTKAALFFIIFLAVVIIITAGYINSRSFVTRTIELTIPKGKSVIEELNIVMVADIHLSPINNEKFLEEIVKKINQLHPDIVLIPGDLVDDHTSVLERHKTGKAFTTIESRYGIFASNGNHEFINGVVQSDNFLKRFNINILRDELILIDSSFYIIGREDRSKNSFTSEKRKALSEIIGSTDRGYPAILLDHTPVGLEEAEINNIDLQLSGHTHNGQLFPANLITKAIYELSWGYKMKGKTHYYVTSGIGTWGPPVKIASDPEIVNIKMKFKE